MRSFLTPRPAMTGVETTMPTPQSLLRRFVRLAPLVVLATAACSKPAAEEAAPEPPVQVAADQVAMVDSLEVESGPALSGTLTAERTAQVRSQMSGTVLALYVKEGQAAHKRRAAVLHHRPHVREIYVDDAGTGDQGGDTARCIQQHFIGLLEGVLEGNPLPDDRQQPLVRYDNHRVNVSPELGDPHFGLLHPLPPLEEERLGDDADGEGADVLGNLCNNRGSAGAGAAAHAAGDEHQVRSLKMLEDLVPILLDRLASDFRAGARSKAARQLLADLHLDVGPRGREGLGVGIDRNELHAAEGLGDHAIDGISAATADPDHLHPRILR
jgi:hypothetical protein